MQIIGHRGARGEAPENTLGGFQYLHDLGIRAVEFDVRQLHDQTLLVIHDDDTLRTSGIKQGIYELTAQDAHRFNLCQNWDTWHQVEPIPTLQEVLSILKDFEHIEVEVKPVKDQASAERIIHTLQMELSRFKDQVTITSFDLQILDALHQQDSDFKRGLLIEIPIGEHAIDLAVQYGCSRIGWKDSFVTQKLITLSHQAQLATSVWTVNDLERAKQLQDFGIHGLITDYPKLMQQHLQ